jgi:nucleoside transporter
MTQTNAQPAPAAYTRLSIMMFLQFFVWGVFFVAMGKFLSVIFKDEAQLNTIIADAYATQTIAGMLAPLLVGLLADRYFPAQIVNGVLHLLGGGLLWLTGTAATPGQFWAYLLGFFLCYMPTLALVNSITFQHVVSPDRDFPRVRVWGTIGWIVGGLVVAQSFFSLFKIPLFDIADVGATNLPYKIGAVVAWIYGLYSFTLPNTPPAAKGEPISVGKALGLDALVLFKDRAFAIFAICSFLICIPLAFYYARTNDYISSVGVRASESKMALGQMSEIFFMLLVPFFMTRLGVKWMLLVGMVAWALRYVLFGLFPSNHALLLLGVILHGICYDFFFVTGQLYVDRKAPRTMRSSAQALIALLTYGAGMFIGNKILGWWADSQVQLKGTADVWLAKAAQFWLFPAGLAAVVTVAFFVLFRDKKIEAEVKEQVPSA